MNVGRTEWKGYQRTWLSMNIFFLDKNPFKNAKCYYNRHVVKIILEITQMLYTVLAPFLSLQETRLQPYKPTHTNHPMNIWLCQSLDNVKFVLVIARSLVREYRTRYQKNHRCSKHLEFLYRLVNDPAFEEAWNKRVILKFRDTTTLAYLDPDEPQFRNLTKIPLCMPEKYHSNSALLSYRLYYLMDKRHVRTKTEHDGDATRLDRKLFEQWRIQNKLSR